MMPSENASSLSAEELEQQYSAELPARDLMIGISLLGIPLVNIDGLAVNINTSGPNWLIGSVGKVA